MYTMTPTDRRNINLADKALKRQDRVTALKYYLKAAENGNDDAMVDCGRIYFEGIFGVEQDTEKAVEWFKKAGELGNSAALNNIGYIYNTNGNHKAAISWYEKAANLGDVVAMLNLSNTYLRDLNNKSKAREWLKKAESLTDTYSIRKVADYYFQEDVIKTHVDKAVSLYKKAIKLGDTQAYKELGDLFFQIDEYEDAHFYYQKGAAAGNVDCMVNLGMMLLCAPDCFAPSYYWLTKAVKMGDTYAMKVLCDLYEMYGNYAKALRWCRKAALAGEREAIDFLPTIKKRLKKHKSDYKLRLRNLAD